MTLRDRNLPETSASSVTISTPASAAYLSLLRVSTANIMARLDFNLDEIEDARIGVSEATAILLEQALPGSEIRSVFSTTDDSVTVELSVAAADPQQPGPDSFAWMVLSTLMEDVSASVSDDRLTLRLTKQRGDV